MDFLNDRLRQAIGLNNCQQHGQENVSLVIVSLCKATFTLLSATCIQVITFNEKSM